MLFDHRTYTCKPGTLPKQMALYEKHGMRAQQRHLGKPLFYAVTETGPVNSFVHIWVYKDRKSTRLNSSHSQQSRMPSSA